MEIEGRDRNRLGKMTAAIPSMGVPRIRSRSPPETLWPTSSHAQATLLFPGARPRKYPGSVGRSPGDGDERSDCHFASVIFLSATKLPIVMR